MLPPDDTGFCRNPWNVKCFHWMLGMLRSVRGFDKESRALVGLQLSIKGSCRTWTSKRHPEGIEEFYRS